jgi:hypothetical protein
MTPVTGLKPTGLASTGLTVPSDRGSSAAAITVTGRAIACIIATLLAVLGLAGGLSLTVLASPGGSTPLHRTSAQRTNPIVGIAHTADGHGYWLVATDGGVFTFGTAQFYGSTGAIHLNRPIVGMAATPDGAGYWLVASDGGIFTFGDAQFYGSTGALTLNRPIVGMASTPDGRGYWLVASDGGIFTFGDAQFYGSTGALVLNRPVVGMASTPDGGGYWLVASDGGIFTFGDAQFFGSTGALVLNKPIVGMASTPRGRGYWLVASDGGIFTFGDAPFLGSTGGAPLGAPTAAVSTDFPGSGYWTVTDNGDVSNFGDAPALGSLVNAVSGNPNTANPPQNIAPNPNFLAACYPHNSGPSCMTQVEQATTAARAIEGLGPMSLPSNFGSLTPADQLFVITDIERVDRGLPPFVGLVDDLNADALAGAQQNTDPGPSLTPPGMHVTAWGSNWAENGNPLGSNYFWMYDDGPNSGNIDCTAPGQPGCWGHRDNILSLSDYQALYGGTLLMGAGEAYGTFNNQWESDATLMVLASGPVPPLSYTWAAAVAAGAG